MIAPSCKAPPGAKGGWKGPAVSKRVLASFERVFGSDDFVSTPRSMNAVLISSSEPLQTRSVSIEFVVECSMCWEATLGR